MINLPPADWKHIQAQIAAASKQSMHAGTHISAFILSGLKTNKKRIILLSCSKLNRRFESF